MRLFEINDNQVLVLSTPQERRKYATQVWELAKRAYVQRELGLAGAQLEDLINAPGMWKIGLNTQGVANSGVIYREFKGYKMRLVLHDGTREGKDAFKELMRQEVANKTFWCEVTGPVEKFLIGLGMQKIPNKFASKLLEKPIHSYDDDGYHYVRDVHNGTMSREILLGYPKV